MKDKIKFIKDINKEVLELQEQENLLKEQYDILWSKNDEFEDKIESKEQENAKTYYSVDYERDIVNRFDFYQKKLKEKRKEILILTAFVGAMLAGAWTIIALAASITMLSPLGLVAGALVMGSTYLMTTRSIKKELKHLKKYDIELFRKKVTEVDAVVAKNKVLIKELVSEKDASFEQLLEIKKEMNKFDKQIEELKIMKANICIFLVEEKFIQNEEQNKEEQIGRTYKLKNNLKRH